MNSPTGYRISDEQIAQIGFCLRDVDDALKALALTPVDKDAIAGILTKATGGIESIVKKVIATRSEP